jgi:RNA polymerase sigma-70 factor (ECF subfamily)
MDNDSDDSARLLERARAGDQAALYELLGQHRARLRRMVEPRLDRRLQARIDASDVIQEAYVDVVNRLDEYLRQPTYPPVPVAAVDRRRTPAEAASAPSGHADA